MKRIERAKEEKKPGGGVREGGGEKEGKRGIKEEKEDGELSLRNHLALS